ncbi:MAG: pyridoxal phosphate-dependent aminotransferase [Candidatus Angelobacter sp. Gp1-AA117]|nr:MAG: pyridoxal phosphate-dependent aminotransferase [Candidatus Angelobacter sp. Gp1-AA117]
MFAGRTNWNLTTNKLTQALAGHRASGREVLDLSVSNPTECGFRYDQKAIMRALCSPASLEYHPDPKGLEQARRAVAGYYEGRGGMVKPEEIILTTSTSEAYSYVFRLLCNPGDELLIPTPSYPLFDFLADIQDVKLKRYPLIYDHGWQIDFHGLQQAMTERTRGVIVVHPNNPTGHFTKPAEMAQLSQICATRQMTIIADEVFLDFALEEQRPQSFTSSQEALTFTLSGLSKISGLPQMKFAWLATSGPENLKTEALSRLEMIADTFLSMNAPVQLAAAAFLEQRYSFQSQLMQRVRNNLKELAGQLAAQRHCSRLELEGGWYAVLRVPATRSDEELAIALLQEKDVYVHPGHLYDFHQEGILVVSLITPESVFATGLARLLEVVTR